MKTGIYLPVFFFSLLLPVFSALSPSMTPIALAVPQSLLLAPLGIFRSHLSVKQNLSQWSEMVSGQQNLKVCAQRVCIINCRSHWTETSVSLCSVHLSNEGKARARKSEGQTERRGSMRGMMKRLNFWFGPLSPGRDCFYYEKTYQKMVHFKC